MKGSTTTRYIGAYEVDLTSGAETKKTTYYPGGAMRVNIVGGTNTVYYLLKDHPSTSFRAGLGSASTLLDASGNVVTNGEQRYYPFGESRLTGGDLKTAHLFTGQLSMGSELGGIYHYGARFYSPRLGRFLSADTIIPRWTDPQSWNRYSYGYNNPIKYTDPTGHCAILIEGEVCYTPYPGSGHVSQGGPPPIGAGDTGSYEIPASIGDEGDCTTMLCDVNSSEPDPSLQQSQDEEDVSLGVAVLSGVGIILDLTAATTNSLYSIAYLMSMAFFQPAVVPLKAAYPVFSVIPNTFSTLATAVWVAQGFITGENSLKVSNTSISVSVSQDTLVSGVTNTLGWTILKDPLAATAVDDAVVFYDLGRAPMGPANTPWFIPTIMNPTLTYTYSTNSLSFKW